MGLWAGLRLPGGVVPSALPRPFRWIPKVSPWMSYHSAARRLTLGSTCLLAAVGQTRSGSRALRRRPASARLSFLLITLLRSLSWLAPHPRPVRRMALPAPKRSWPEKRGLWGLGHPGPGTACVCGGRGVLGGSEGQTLPLLPLP